MSGTNTAPVDISDDSGKQDYMVQAAAAIAKAKADGGPVKVEIGQSAAQKASIEKAAKAETLRQLMAEQKGLVARPQPMEEAAAPAVELTEEEQAAADEADAAAAAAAAKTKAAEKAAVETAAKKAAEQHAAVKDMLKAAASSVTTEEDGPVKSVPLKFTSEKLGAGVSLGGDGSVASAGATVCQLTDVWMRGGRKPLIWTVAIALDEVLPETTIGIVGRNFWSREWESSLETSQHAIVMRCGDGAIRYKGKGTSFILRPVASGARLTITLDMQTLEMTLDLVGKDNAVLSSLTVENIQAEVAIAVGFAKGAPQTVRLVGCTSEKPGMVLTGKLRKDLWDDDNIQTPLTLNAKADGGQKAINEAVAAMAATLD